MLASPPCAAHSMLANLPRMRAPEAILVEATITRLSDYQKVRSAQTYVYVPWSVENVPGAVELLRGAAIHVIRLCGTMFGLSCILPPPSGFERCVDGCPRLPASRQDARDTWSTRHEGPLPGGEAGLFERAARRHGLCRTPVDPTTTVQLWTIYCYAVGGCSLANQLGCAIPCSAGAGRGASAMGRGRLLSFISTRCRTRSAARSDHRACRPRCCVHGSESFPGTKGRLCRSLPEEVLAIPRASEKRAHRRMHARLIPDDGSKLQDSPLRVVYESITAPSSAKSAWSEARRRLSFSHDDYTLHRGRIFYKALNGLQLATCGTRLASFRSFAGLPS
eukprot:6195849-Pleurochrysis_carterae.AAC.1